jgi:hypothetical protein
MSRAKGPNKRALVNHGHNSWDQRLACWLPAYRRECPDCCAACEGRAAERLADLRAFVYPMVARALAEAER